jgi:hypothetical protein
MSQRRNLRLLTNFCPVIIIAEEITNMPSKKVKEEELNILEAHQEYLREARIKLMGVLETYIASENMPLREAIMIFASSNMWDVKKASRYLQLMSAPDSVFKKAQLIKSFEGA